MTAKPKPKPKAKRPDPSEEDRLRCLRNVEQLVLEGQALAEKSRPIDVVAEMLLAAALFAQDREIELMPFLGALRSAISAALREQVAVEVRVHRLTGDDDDEDDDDGDGGPGFDA